MAWSPSVHAKLLKVGALFAITTGSADILFGLKPFTYTSGPLSVNPSVYAVIDNQVRFFGAVWAGYGAILWWTANDLKTRRTPLGILCGIMIVGGIGRLASALTHGFGATWTAVATFLELFGPPALYLLGC
ncbi:hypothetical protein VFPPC_18273 [Pochonia chlamydosporia 170]|uniref:DUF4345 domain-containing protein n=1 Tax=Pochonia chlamydosporia 170 TaxID=1380566 RepID=A0A219APU8_METCM|nr:hypothetical protein VFPPC_18273 [Pochonia chlamydosporia 170]OWT42582.1 hypothetical protein VFPPC_18273 [Pochonia chlamydosporia 170]